jgi:alanyl-tRNA synthetase
VLHSTCSELFSIWREEKKYIERKRKEGVKKDLEKKEVEDVFGYEIIIKELNSKGLNLVNYAKELSGEKRIVVLFGIDDGISIVALRGDANVNMGELVKDVSALLNGKGGGRPDFGQGRGIDVKKIEMAKKIASERIKKDLVS